MPDPIVLPRLTRVRGAAARSSTWWGRALVRSFEELTVEAGDLVAARALARAGRLGAIVVLEAMASAVVDPGSEGPLMAQVKVDRLDGDGWTTFAREAARESGYAAALEVRRPSCRPRGARRRGGRRGAARARRHRHRVRLRLVGPAVRAHAGAALPAGLAGRPRSLRAAAAPRPDPRGAPRRGECTGIRRHGTRGRGARGGPHPGSPGAGARRGCTLRPRAGRCRGGGVRRGRGRLL